MKKLLIFILLLISAKTVLANDFWTTTFEEGAPSCSLYRKRIANFYNRLKELQLASKVVNSNLTPHEIARLMDISTRIGIPLSSNEMATWGVEIPVGEMNAKLKDSLVKIDVTSELFNWESDKFIFPADIMNVTTDLIKKTMKIELIMPFPYACLQTIALDIVFSWKDGTRSELHFVLDKTKWERERP